MAFVVQRFEEVTFRVRRFLENVLSTRRFGIAFSMLFV